MNDELKTIGYGNKTFESFLTILKTNDVKIIVDVRTNPFSRFSPNFRKNTLQELLVENDIQYIFMGDTLGGKPKDESCYTDGVVDYNKLKAQPKFTG